MKTISNHLTAEILLADLAQTALKLDKKTLTANDYRRHGEYSIMPFYNHLGSWKNACRKAGLAPDKAKHPAKQRSIGMRLRYLILSRDNFKCVCCGASPAKNPNIELHLDHIIPYSKGGETEPGNCALSAHSAIGAKEETKNGKTICKFKGI